MATDLAGARAWWQHHLLDGRWQAGEGDAFAVLAIPSAPIKAVAVNGPSTGSGEAKPGTEFNKDKETITLPQGLTGTVAVTAQY